MELTAVRNGVISISLRSGQQVLNSAASAAGSGRQGDVRRSAGFGSSQSQVGSLSKLMLAANVINKAFEEKNNMQFEHFGVVVMEMYSAAITCFYGGDVSEEACISNEVPKSDEKYQVSDMKLTC